MNPADEIKNVWNILSVSEDSIWSIRALKPYGSTEHLPAVNWLFTPVQYPDVEDRKRAFERKALSLDRQGYNVYAVMNPIKSGFDGDAVSDNDIDRREVLLIDIDRSGDTKCPASDAEVQAAVELGAVVADCILGEGFEEPLKVMSGNGVHLYCRLKNLPNDERSRAVIETVLKSLAEKFDNEAVRIDTAVFNASRITKVPGTTAKKGTESADRPYRMARVI